MTILKKISIIGTVGIPAKYGGFETLTEYLTKHLSNDYELTVYCSAKSYAEQPASYHGTALEYINLKANGDQSIPYEIVSLTKDKPGSEKNVRYVLFRNDNNLSPTPLIP